MRFPRFLARIGPLLLLCLGGCRTAPPAFFSPAQPAYVPSLMQAPDRVTQAPAPAQLPTPAPASEPVEAHYSATQRTAAPSLSARLLPPAHTPYSALAMASIRHSNPDLTVSRKPAWLYRSQLMAGSQSTYTASQIIPDVHPSKRRVPKGVFYALAGSVMPYGLFILAPVSPWVWVLSLTLPLASMLVATGSLAKIRRNKSQFRGRGWAALALILATSFVGMALVTLAALATSGILWE
ncbi:hypothetical protein [Fibrella aquatilis]|uniref:DUF4190 domain-containing protein n=1 Tax=Fibrella aquatilis TaxID=2817059 RepID=A0A939G4I4_9BACT|nr:hypothetical protein [Fibrella aquatilis]MBO0929658.1 hypothetical protein [Fibrella aquatilis]